jgi:hypothetical protein
MSDGREERDEQEQRRRWREQEDTSDRIDHPHREEDDREGHEPS